MNKLLILGFLCVIIFSLYFGTMRNRNPVVGPEIREYDAVVIGAGLTGGVIARQLADAGWRVLIIEKRNHIAGNCYDYYNKEGILVPAYGLHIFHTNDSDVFDYLSRFTSWRPYRHSEVITINGSEVSFPINRQGINSLFHLNLSSEEDAEDWLNQRRRVITTYTSAEDALLATVGDDLYNSVYRVHVAKRWKTHPRVLDKAMVEDMMVRTNMDTDRFHYTYQATPSAGYTSLWLNLTSHPLIQCWLATDYTKFRFRAKMIFTGRIDEFFDYSMGVLPFRSLRFEHFTIQKEFAQSSPVVNSIEPGSLIRTYEPKRATGQVHQYSTLIREYNVPGNESLYAVPSLENEGLAARYRSMNKRVYFVGRLADYRNYDMDQAVKRALDVSRRILTDQGDRVPESKTTLSASPPMLPVFKRQAYDIRSFIPRLRTEVVNEFPSRVSKLPKGLVAFFTIVKNEYVYLPIAIRYYRQFFELEDMLIIDNDSSDYSTSRAKIPKGIKVERILSPGEDYYDYTFLARTAIEKQAQLLQTYKAVLFIDIDEMIVPDPDLYPGGLTQYILAFLNSRNVSIKTIGKDIWHNTTCEPDLDFNRPIFQQRSYFHFDQYYDKTLLSKIPLHWRAGFHKTEEPETYDPNLSLFHLQFVDYSFFRARLLWKYLQKKHYPRWPGQSASFNETSQIADFWRNGLGLENRTVPIYPIPTKYKISEAIL